ncbi:MAG TPA: ATP-binding protein [Verrucomicrobiae bacterium]|nr:ATP-binding protein [Verrucomicrobiae bacterium]
MPFIPTIPPELRAAYQEEDRDKTIRKTQWGCIYGIILVPLFGLLDFYMFPHEQAVSYLRLRLICSALMAGLYPVLGTSFGKKYYHFQGIVLLLLPSATIAWMVYANTGDPSSYDAGGTASPYYAGLTLVLMVLAVVLDWPFWQSVVSVVLVLLLYVTACKFSRATFDLHLFTQNLFFLVSSGIAIIAGTAFHSRVRLREFIARRELDESNKKLEASLQELKENRMKLVRSEKQAALGRMCAGIIHDVNNPLNYVITNLFTLGKKGKLLAPDQQADYTEILNDVVGGVTRVKTIVSNLRIVTQPSTEQLNEVPVAGAVAEALRFLSKDTVTVQQEIAGHQTVRVNKDKLIQVLENLLKNALDALKSRAFAAGETPTIRITGRVANGRSMLSVRDNGCGIDPKHLDKIFDPFFTTKDVGAGMGLGLFICNSIVEEYGGNISVKSEPGKFCEFTLEFPGQTNQPDNGR